MSIIAGTITLLDRYPYGQVSKTLPVSKEVAREHIQLFDTIDDGLVFGSSQQGFGGYVLSATGEVENRGQVALITQKRRLILGDFDKSIDGLAFDLQFTPVISILQVKYLDVEGVERTLSTSLYRLLLSGGIVFKTGCPTVLSGPDTLWVDYECGFGNSAGAVPAEWQNCVLNCATHRYERREGAAGGAFDAAWEKAFDNSIKAAGRRLRYG